MRLSPAAPRFSQIAVISASTTRQLQSRAFEAAKLSGPVDSFELDDWFDIVLHDALQPLDPALPRRPEFFPQRDGRLIVPLNNGIAHRDLFQHQIKQSGTRHQAIKDFLRAYPEREDISSQLTSD